MDALDLFEARDVFSAYSDSKRSDSDAIYDYLSINSGGRTVRIGQEDFRSLASAMARDAERNIGLACGTFAHSLEGTMKGTVSWAAVGFYYAAYYSARAIALTSGCWYESKKSWIDVDRTPGGKIGFKINRSPHPSLIVGRGPHKDFWSFYHLVANEIAPDVDIEHQWAVIPGATEIDQMHDLRLALNYDIRTAVDIATAYIDAYADGEFESWITGQPATLYQHARSYIAYAISRARSVGLDAGVFQGKFAGPADFSYQQLNWKRNRAVENDVQNCFI